MKTNPAAADKGMGTKEFLSFPCPYSRVPEPALLTMKLFVTCVAVAASACLQATDLESKLVDLGGGVSLELVELPPGKFLMGSTPEEKAWATGIEGGAAPGTTRESFEGEARVRCGSKMALRSGAPK